MSIVSDAGLHEAFLASGRKHILQLTHGLHEWEVIPGLPDTGGQNVFVNQLSETLAALGHRVTIANRGGFRHPKTGEVHRGIDYKDADQRILYTEDGDPRWVRKEDMDAHTPRLAAFLADHLRQEGIDIDLIISHYWDGARIGTLVNEKLEKPVQHLWVPHSLGAVKKRNMDPSTWVDLRIDERIAVERSLVPGPDATAATSSVIRKSLVEDYGAKDPVFLPPCVQTHRFHPREIPDDHEIYHFLAETARMSVDEVRRARIITEISRTDTTKRKNVLIEAFARVLQEAPDALLAVAIDPTEKELSGELFALIDRLGVRKRVAVLGNIWDKLPYLYATTYVYCSPSVMEGFGMAVQEAAATRVPVVGSDLIPFVKEYLLGDQVTDVPYPGMNGTPLKQGAGGIVVPHDDVEGFAAGLLRLFGDQGLRDEMGEHAFRITVPFFTWRAMVERCFAEIGFEEAPPSALAHVPEPGPEETLTLSAERLEEITENRSLEAIRTEDIFALVRNERAIQAYLPEGEYQVDPRDGSVILFNSSRSGRPHTNVAIPRDEHRFAGANCPICHGNTTGVIDVAELSDGQTFINKNLFPIAYPHTSLADEMDHGVNGLNGSPCGPVSSLSRGVHLLQWTSSHCDRDWHNMPIADLTMVLDRLAVLEQKLLFHDGDAAPRGDVVIIKNYGRLVGGSLQHGHQQILYTNTMPRRFRRNLEFQERCGETFSAYMLRENPDDLRIRDYGQARLIVPYFMRRPYFMQLMMAAPSKRYLHELDSGERADLAMGWRDATRAMMAIMPMLDRPIAYNVVVHNGPGAGLYVEFIPYTQEMGGYELAGLWVCQETPLGAAARIVEVLDELDRRATGAPGVG